MSMGRIHFQKGFKPVVPKESRERRRCCSGLWPPGADLQTQLNSWHPITSLLQLETQKAQNLSNC